MSKRSIRLASIANQLYLEERLINAGIWDKIKGLFTDQTSKILEKSMEISEPIKNYLQKSNKQDLSPLPNNNIKSILRTLTDKNKGLLPQLETMAERPPIDRELATQVIPAIKELIKLLEENQELISKNKEAEKQFSQALVQSLFGKAKTASDPTPRPGTTEPLEDDGAYVDKDYCSDEDDEEEKDEEIVKPPQE